MRYVIDLINCWGKEYKDKALFSMVYIQEAHAIDEWPINSSRLSKKGLRQNTIHNNNNNEIVGNVSSSVDVPKQSETGLPICYRQHQNINERIQAATDFVNDNDVDVIKDNINSTNGNVLVLADTIDNTFQTIYAAWPIRWYIFQTKYNDNDNQDNMNNNNNSSTQHSISTTSGTSSTNINNNNNVYITHIGEPDEASFDMCKVQNILDTEF